MWASQLQSLHCEDAVPVFLTKTNQKLLPLYMPSTLTLGRLVLPHLLQAVGTPCVPRRAPQQSPFKARSEMRERGISNVTLVLWQLFTPLCHRHPPHLNWIAKDQVEDFLEWSQI